MKYAIGREARRALQPCTLVVLLLIVVGCQRNEAGIRLDECLTAAEQRARSQMSTAETECNFGREVWVVGLPSGKPTVDELQALGLPESASLGLAHEQYASPQWCVVVEVNPAQVPPGVSQEERRQFDVDCTFADQDIHELKVIRASEIRMKLTPRSDSEPAQLDVSKAR